MISTYIDICFSYINCYQCDKISITSDVKISSRESKYQRVFKNIMFTLFDNTKCIINIFNWSSLNNTLFKNCNFLRDELAK